MLSKPLKVVFCLPGSSFSGRFIDCWSDFLVSCYNHGVQPMISRRESCNIYYVRNMCLGADVSRGKNQKPFNSKIDYDYIMWIDSDIIFNFEQFVRLVKWNTDIVAGVYPMENGKQLATCQKWAEEHFKQNGYFEFLTEDDVKGKEGLIEVSYTGMGFMLVKKGVFEAMEYPWFRPLEKQIGDMVDFTMEDVAFCLCAKEKGFKVLIDPQVKVGHEKKIVF